MNCFICKGEMSPYFSKNFGGSFGLNTVDYWECQSCGLVVSKTHFEMTQEEWEELNVKYHSSFQGTDKCEDDPRWVERLTLQFERISDLAGLGVLQRPTDDMPWVDYACGDGKLADMLADQGLKTLKFEYYMNDKNGQYLSKDKLMEKKYGVVINTSMFEHVRGIDELDIIPSLISSSGVLAVHTVVCENVPKDSSWFYLLPVHCVVYTNRSMQILFDRWGFESSIYNVDSRMWFWFREDGGRIREILELNGLTGTYHYKNGFMDYWR